MRIFIDGYIFWIQKVGGINSYWSNLIPKMAEIDKNNKFYIYLKPYSNNRQIEGISNIKLLKSKSKLPVKEYNLIEDRVIRKYVSKIKPDIFHSTYYRRLKHSNIPNIVTVFDTIPELFPQYFPPKIDHIFYIKKETILNANRIIAISQNTKKDLIKIYNLPENKINVIYVGIDTKKFRQIQDEKLKNLFMQKYALSKPYFLYVGKRNGYKNFITLLKAFANSHLKYDFMIVAIGGGSELSSEEAKIIEKHNLDHSVKFLGAVSTDELILAYNNAVALVMPSIYEGFGLPILEAMSCGCPVLSSNTSSLPEVAGNAALLFNPEGIEDLGYCLEKVIEPNIRKDFINKGLKRIKFFSWDTIAKEIIAVYKNILGVQDA